MWPDSGYEGWFLVEGSVFEHAVDYVAASAREADDSGVVVLALFAFALVVGDGRRVFGGRDEQGLPQRVLRRLLPRLEGLSPLMLVPDWPVAGAMPA